MYIVYIYVHVFYNYSNYVTVTITLKDKFLIRNNMFSQINVDCMRSMV